MGNTREVNEAIKRILENWKNMSPEELKKEFEEHVPGDIYRSLMYADWMESGASKIQEEREYFRVHNNIHFRDVV